MTSDIDPRSGSRLPLLQREALDEEGQRAFDRTAAPGGSIAGLQGPGGMGLYSSGTSAARHALYQYLRFEAGYSAQVREVAFLAVARELDCQFEWSMHEMVALKEGVSPDLIDVIRHRSDTRALPDLTASVIELVRETCGAHKVSPETYARALQHFGPHTLVDLVLLIGSATSTAALLTAFDMQPRPNTQPGLPMPKPATPPADG